MRRLFPSLVLSLAVLLTAAGPSPASDIATFDQARDRFAAQVTQDRTDVLAVYGDPALAEGPVTIAAPSGGVSLGDGPGWLFAAKIQAALADLYVLAFVGQDAAVTTRMAKSLPKGLVLLADKKTNAAPSPVANADEAYARLLSGLLGHSAKGRRIYTAGKTGTEAIIPSWKEDIVLTGGPGWVFFVDDSPRANWTHACRYVLVSGDGTLNAVAAKTPPRDMSAFTELTSWSEPGFSSPNALAVKNAPLITRNITPADNRYAVIISGGWNRFNNHPRYWNDCSFFYATLKNYGFRDENIFVLFADGTDPAVDQADGVTSSPLDLDGDGDPDIGYSATKENLSLVFDRLAARLSGEDLLYIFTTDHGDAQADNAAPYATPNVTLCLWDEQEVTGDELAAEVNKVQAKAIVGIFEQCYSGGLVERLKGPNRVLMSASRWWELSYAMNDLPMDEFSYYATKALAEPTAGDSNGDGIVAMEEAYLYALAHDSYQMETLDSYGDNNGEHPAYFSNPWDLGRRISLAGQGPLAAPRQMGYLQKETGEEYPAQGEAQGWQADDAMWSLDLPFSFPFGAASYKTVKVSSNGFISLSGADLGPFNAVGLFATGQAVAPLWDDLTTEPAGCDIHVAATAQYADIAWTAKTVIDARPVNMTARLYPSGNVTFFYGEGNEHIARLNQRDKTIGLANAGGLALGLANGASSLGFAPSLTFTRQSLTAAPTQSIMLLMQ